MGSGAGSELLVRVALAAGLVAIGLSVAVAGQVLLMRWTKLRRERRRERFLDTWRPLLYEAALGSAPPAPTLAPRDEASFLLLWNQLQDGLRGPPREGLNQLARAVGARGAALRRLRRGGALSRLLALRTLGYLGQAEDYDRVLAFLDVRPSALCLAAARALAHIDPRRAADEIWGRLGAHPDWPVAQLATVLREADVSRLAEHFVGSATGMPSAELQRLLPLVSLLDERSAGLVVGELLAGTDDPEVLAGALKHVRSAALLPRVARLCGHQAWPVRTQAAAALGRIGGPPERGLLVGLLGDPQWWVRYRAAQSLLGGAFGSRSEIAALAQGLEDRFARDIVTHVLAEGRA